MGLKGQSEPPQDLFEVHELLKAGNLPYRRPSRVRRGRGMEGGDLNLAVEALPCLNFPRRHPDDRLVRVPFTPKQGGFGSPGRLGSHCEALKSPSARRTILCRIQAPEHPARDHGSSALRGGWSTGVGGTRAPCEVGWDGLQFGSGLGLGLVSGTMCGWLGRLLPEAPRERRG